MIIQVYIRKHWCDLKFIVAIAQVNKYSQYIHICYIRFLKYRCTKRNIKAPFVANIVKPMRNIKLVRSLMDDTHVWCRPANARKNSKMIDIAWQRSDGKTLSSNSCSSSKLKIMLRLLAIDQVRENFSFVQTELSWLTSV